MRALAMLAEAIMETKRLRFCRNRASSGIRGGVEGPSLQGAYGAE